MVDLSTGEEFEHFEEITVVALVALTLPPGWMTAFNAQQAQRSELAKPEAD